MSLESVRKFFAEKAPDITVIESTISSATVVLAAEAYGVEPARIGKTLSLRVGERVVLIVTSGTSRMDNKKVKTRFGVKPKMLGLDEVADITGHEVGGVCPFGLKTPLPIYCDVSLKAFDEVVPAAGSTHSAVRITPSNWSAPNGSMCVRYRTRKRQRLTAIDRCWGPASQRGVSAPPQGRACSRSNQTPRGTIG
jgi:prolyl-tRNA editing enzyme YbaK/EbsC (Cys-tRNA(Pro) deacylase)